MPKTKSTKKRTKKLDIYDVDHPFRKIAIEIISTIVEPLIQRGIYGREYSQIEDQISLLINKKILPIVQKNKLQPAKKNAKKGILDPRRHEDDNRDAADMDLSEYMMENMDDGDEEFEPLDPHTAKEIIKGRNIEEENDFYGAYK